MCPFSRKNAPKAASKTAGPGRPKDLGKRAAILEAAKALIGPKTAGILVEPIQGEGGIRPASQEFMAGLRALCDEHGLMLILDEVQCGVARTGKLYAYEHYGIEPDIGWHNCNWYLARSSGWSGLWWHWCYNGICGSHESGIGDWDGYPWHINDN